MTGTELRKAPDNGPAATAAGTLPDNADLLPIDESLRGTFMTIGKLKLTVPIDDYQRNRKNSARAKEIARRWNWAAVGALTVIRRQTGEYVVADGGTRLSAALLRPDVIEVPCMVHNVSSVKDEAEIFRLINMARDKLRVREYQKSDVCEGRNFAIQVEAFIAELEKGNVVVECLADLRKKFEVPGEGDRCFRLLPLFRDLATGKRLTARVLKGVASVDQILEDRGESIVDRRYSTKLKRLGVAAIEMAITGAMPSRGGGNSRIYAQAILNLLKIKVD